MLVACNHEYSLQISSFICLIDLPIGVSDHKMLTWVISDGSDKQHFCYVSLKDLLVDEWIWNNGEKASTYTGMMLGKMGNV